MTRTVRVITQLLETNTSKVMMILIYWRLISQNQVGLKLTTLVLLNLKKVSSQIKAAFKENLNQIECKKFKASDSNTISKPFQSG